MRSVLVEPDALCGKLRHIAAVENVVGGHTSGPELAAAIAQDVGRAELCEVVLGARVSEVRAYGDHVSVTTATGRTVDASYAVVATGVGPVSVRAASWLTAATDLPTLWGAEVPDRAPVSFLVLGAVLAVGQRLTEFKDHRLVPR